MTTKQKLIAAIIKASGLGGPCNVDEALPIQAQTWARTTAESLKGTYPNGVVLEKFAQALVDHQLKYDREAIGL